MIIESSAIFVKSQIAKLLVNFRVETLDREAVVLDIVEFIALRLGKPNDDEVFNLALFVSTNLSAFLAGTVAYIDVHSRLTRAALAARLGSTEFLRSLNFG